MVAPRKDSARPALSRPRSMTNLLPALVLLATACTYHPVTVGPDIGVIHLSASPNVALANSIDSVSLALHARLADATEASGIPVAFVVEAADSNSLRLEAPVTDANGRSAAALLTATPGTRTITAWLLLGTTWTRLDETVSVEFLRAAGAVSATASPSTVIADGLSTATLTVLVTNEAGQPLPNQSVTVATSMPGVLTSPTTGLTDAEGLLVASVSSRSVGDANVTVTSPYGATSTRIAFIVGPPDAAQSSLQVLVADGVPADGNSMATVEASLRDAEGHAIPNVMVRFSGGADVLLGPNLVVTDADGSARTTLRSPYAGAPMIQATAGTVSLQARGHFTARTPWCSSGKLLLPRRARTLTTAAHPWDIRLGDMNGDGFNDIITTNLTAPVGPVIFQGAGDGTFLPGVQTPIAMGSGPGLWVGDFNGDGKRDVAIASEAGQLSLFVGQNRIPIQNGNSYATGLPLGNQVCSGEFNNDAKTDFVVTSSNTPSTTGNPNTLVVMFGDGQGGLVAGPQSRVGSALGECASQDINGDGKSDVVVASAGDQNVYVLLGNGNGTFQAPMGYVTFAGTGPIRLQDFDKDSKLDIATAGAGAVGYLAGLGSAVFAPAVVYPVAGARFTGLRNVDFDRDGDQDLIAVDSLGGRLSVLLGQGDGTFSQAVTSSLGGLGRDLAPGDVDGDGKPDVATTLIHAGSVGVYLNGNSTFFVGPPTYRAAASYLSAADFNNDGVLDVVASGGGGPDLTVMLGVGDGNFIVSSLTVGAGVTCARAADITADGNQDLLVGDGSTGQVTLRRGNGRGGFSAPSATLAVEMGVVDMALADLDGDGDLDLVTVNSVANSLSVLLGSGTGFAPARRYAGLASPTGLGITDLNSDGHPDVAVTNTAGATVSVFLGVGDGSFSRAVDAPVGQNPYFLSSGDFNGDGKPDLAVANHGSTAVSVLLGAGNGSFLPQVAYAVLSAPTSVATTDSNGDGRPDLLVATSGNPGGSLSVLIGLGDGTFDRPQPFQTGNAVYALPGDFNRDGRQDVAVANAQDSLVTVHLATGCE